jgi:RNA polymerase sigma factor (TIGR02999 family)
MSDFICFPLPPDTAECGGKSRQRSFRVSGGTLDGSMDAGANPGEVTLWLERWGHGEPEALDKLAPLVYNQLRVIADGLLHGERAGHTLQPTALVNEAFQQLLNIHRVNLNDRVHFFTFAARLMRRILIDHARKVKADKRGGEFDRIPLNPELAWTGAFDEEMLDLSAALEELESLDADKARALELRYFLGCTVEETASLVGVSPSSVDRSLRFSLAWLHQRLHPQT